MKKVLLSVLLFLIFFSTYGQIHTMQRDIVWNTPKSVSHYYNIEQKNLNKTEYLSFDNAYYYDHSNMIPYYYELIPLQAKNTRVNLKNLEYVALTNEELKIINQAKQIEESINYTQEINYIRSQPYLQLNLLPFRKNKSTGQIEKLVRFEIELYADHTAKSKTVKEAKFTNSSVLKSGNWVKIRVQKSGLYKISYSELNTMGFTNPENIKVFGNSSGMLPIANTNNYQDDLQQNAIYHAGDHILFYTKGPDEWIYNETEQFYNCIKHVYSDYNYLFLTTDIGNQQAVVNESPPSAPAVETLTSFTDYQHHEQELNNLLESGQEWFGEKFDITTNMNFEFDFPNLLTTAPIHVETRVVARSAVSSNFTISSDSQNISSHTLGSVNMSSYTSTFATESVSKGNFTSNSDKFNINIVYDKPTGSSLGWLDYITINAQRKLVLDDKPMEFRYFNQDATSKVIEFRIENTTSETKVWDITNPAQAKNLTLNLVSGNTRSVKIEVKPGLNEFIAFNNSNFLSTEIIGSVENQNLHGENHSDMLIITHPDFIEQANQIKAIHQNNDNLKVLVTTPERIYNEFSSGTRDASAIRNFIRMIYNRPTANDTLKYVLFIGDGSYDHKSILAKNINYVLTYQSENSLNPVLSFLTDDFFGLLDETDNVEATNSGLVDIGIGRLPVRTSSEAQQMVDKIERYINPENQGDWTNQLCFVGDDEDNNIHMRDADKLASFVDTTYPYFFINKIYLDAFPQETSANYESYPEVNRLINDAINNGILIFNYTGHGGENGLAHERIVSIADINSWVNKNQLTVFMTATCEFSRFDNHKYISAGEYVLLNPNGGSIALFSTTRLVYSSPNYTLNRNFYNYVFEKNDKGNYYAFGDIIRLAKNASGTGNNKRNFTLLGDPALKLPLADLNIITDSVNHLDASIYTDTLKALSKVTIHGHIENNSKAPVTNFNGIVYPLVLDKERIVTTLSNDGTSPMSFKVQNNILYKGKASVVNGKFNYTFVVPKDISYNFAPGKISYYSSGTESNAKGHFSNFIIGGTDENATADNIGPDVNLYMNDENFVSGGVTNDNPRLYAMLTDSSGINTVGNGIGHDITAVLDNNTSNIIILNDYYESDVNEYQKGKIEYLFSELDNGEHTLKLKVWDVYNNSTEKEIDFTVAESENLTLKNIFNYPNPFTEQTAFYFDHNRPNEDLHVLIQIFTVSGKLVKTINTIINNNSFRSDAIRWDGLDDFGDAIGRGVYVYQLKVKTIDGETVKKIEKLVILK